MFENWQGTNRMSLSASLDYYKNKQYLTNIEMSPTNLIKNTKKLHGIYTMGICTPWDESYLHY